MGMTDEEEEKEEQNTVLRMYNLVAEGKNKWLAIIQNASVRSSR